jgi:23S rRNA pseudouridine1911/1915/1917 synthase
MRYPPTINHFASAAVNSSRIGECRSMDQNATFVVTSVDPGVRLDQYLAQRLDGLSRSQVQKLIEDGLVFVNGAAARKRHIVSDGESVVVDMQSVRRRLDTTVQPEDIRLDILHEDEALIVINKPAGMVVHPGSGNRNGTLVNALLFHTDELSEGSADDRPGIVHRLDKDTSGVMVVAKTAQAHAALARQFSEHEVGKYYLGVCIGAIAQTHGVFDFPLARSPRDPLRRSVQEGGKPAQTEYWVLRDQSGISVVRFRLRTGRTHQVRAHCSHAHIPIAGDRLYGGGSERIMQLQPMERPFAHKIVKCFARHALHSHILSFVHPTSGKTLTFTAPLPPDFVSALALFDQTIDVALPTA